MENENKVAVKLSEMCAPILKKNEKPLLVLSIIMAYCDDKDSAKRREIRDSLFPWQGGDELLLSSEARDYALANIDEVTRKVQEFRSEYTQDGVIRALAEMYGEGHPYYQELLKQASERGNGLASYQLTQRYYHLCKKQPGLKKQVQFYAKKAIKQGFPNGYYYLACLESPDAIHFSEEGLRLLRLGMAQKSGACADAYGLYYDVGGVKTDLSLAISAFQKAAQWGDPNGTYDYGRTFLGTSYPHLNARLAERYMRLASDLGSTLADYALGRHYSDGDFGKLDYSAAERYFLRGIRQDDPDCYYDLAYLQVFYEIPHPNIRWARDTFLNLSKQGWKSASFNLGSMAFYGYGEEINYDKALYYYLLSAEQGDRRGAYVAGEMLHSGKLVKPDPEKALYLLKLAADHGEVDADMLLAEIYEKGEGVSVDSEVAKTYRAKAEAAKA
jgi:TPR repeat protein